MQGDEPVSAGAVLATSLHRVAALHVQVAVGGCATLGGGAGLGSRA
jgi:hypothetical protein